MSLRVLSTTTHAPLPNIFEAMPKNTDQDVSSTKSPHAGIPELDQYEVHRQAAQALPSQPQPSPTPRERALWAMNRDDLMQEAKRHNFGRPKMGRIAVLREILKKEGITPYVAPRVTAVPTCRPPRPPPPRRPPPPPQLSATAPETPTAPSTTRKPAARSPPTRLSSAKSPTPQPPTSPSPRSTSSPSP